METNKRKANLKQLRQPPPAASNRPLRSANNSKAPTLSKFFGGPTQVAASASQMDIEVIEHEDDSTIELRGVPVNKAIKATTSKRPTLESFIYSASEASLNGDTEVKRPKRESDIFEQATKKPKKAPNLKTVSSRSSKPKRAAKPRGQATIKSAFMRTEQLFSEVTAQHCLAENFNPDELQLALAISKSEAEAQGTEDQQQQLEQEVVVNVGDYESIRQKLQKYGFRTAEKGDYKDLATLFKLPAKHRQKKAKWANKFTALTLRDPKLQEIKLRANVKELLAQQCKTAPPTQEECDLPPCPTTSEYLKRIEVSPRKRFIVAMNRAPSDDLRKFYVKELCDVSLVPCGHLLKDWNKVPGREPSPERASKASSKRRKLQEQRLADALERLEAFYDPSIVILPKELAALENFESEATAVEAEAVTLVARQSEVKSPIISHSRSPERSEPNKRLKLGVSAKDQCETGLRTSPVVNNKFGDFSLSEPPPSTSPHSKTFKIVTPKFDGNRCVSPDIFADSDSDDELQEPPPLYTEKTESSPHSAAKPCDQVASTKPLEVNDNSLQISTFEVYSSDEAASPISQMLNTLEKLAKSSTESIDAHATNTDEAKSSPKANQPNISIDLTQDDHHTDIKELKELPSRKLEQTAAKVEQKDHEISRFLKEFYEQYNITPPNLSQNNGKAPLASKKTLSSVDITQLSSPQNVVSSKDTLIESVDLTQLSTPEPIDCPTEFKESSIDLTQNDDLADEEAQPAYNAKTDENTTCMDENSELATHDWSATTEPEEWCEYLNYLPNISIEKAEQNEDDSKEELVFSDDEVNYSFIRAEKLNTPRAHRQRELKLRRSNTSHSAFDLANLKPTNMSIDLTQNELSDEDEELLKAPDKNSKYPLQALQVNDCLEISDDDIEDFMLNVDQVMKTKSPAVIRRCQTTPISDFRNKTSELRQNKAKTRLDYAMDEASIDVETPSARNAVMQSPNKSTLSRERAEFGILDAPYSEQFELSQPMSPPDDRERVDMNWSFLEHQNITPLKSLKRHSSRKFDELLAQTEKDIEQRHTSIVVDDFDEFDRLVYGDKFTQQPQPVPSGLDRLLTAELMIPATQTSSPAKQSQPPDKNATELETVEYDGRVYSVRACHSAKPDFTHQTDAELLKQLYQYGIKPLKRNQAIKMLEFIYIQTHPLMEEPPLTAALCKSKSMPVSSTRDQPLLVATQNTQFTEKSPLSGRKAQQKFLFCDAPGEQLLRLSSVMRAILPGEDYIFQTNITKKTQRPLLPLHIAWHNLIAANPDLHQAVLLFEPIDLQEIFQQLKTIGCRYDPKDLKAFFDRRCIVFRYDVSGGVSNNRHVRKPKTSRKVIAVS